MAARSPSPNHTRPRTPENSNPLRRSTGGGPLFSTKHSNNPQEKGVSGPKPATRSPVVNGTKNFMAPTISASSKSVSASPRRKILGERNEQIYSEEIAAKHEMGFCSQDNMVVKKEVKKYVSATPISSPVATIAPLDADPSLPPYDPKTNYLSPRPRYLHYRPNPRIEHYRRREEEVDEEELDLFELRAAGPQIVDGSLSSESSEDAFSQSQETRSSMQDGSDGSSLKESSLENPLSDCFQEIEVQETTVVEEANEIEKKEDAGIHVARPKSKATFSRSAVCLLVLVPVFACLFVQVKDSLINYQSVEKVHSSTLRVFDEFNFRDHLFEAANIAKMEFLEIANRFQHWPYPTAFVTSVSPVHEQREVPLISFPNLTTACAVKQLVDFNPVDADLPEKNKVLVHELEPIVQNDIRQDQEEETTAVNKSEEDSGVHLLAREKEMEEIQKKNVAAVEEETNPDHATQNAEIVVEDFTGDIVIAAKEEGTKLDYPVSSQFDDISSDLCEPLSDLLEPSSGDHVFQSVKPFLSLNSCLKDKLSTPTSKDSEVHVSAREKEMEDIQKKIAAVAALEEETHPNHAMQNPEIVVEDLSDDNVIEAKEGGTKLDHPVSSQSDDLSSGLCEPISDLSSDLLEPSNGGHVSQSVKPFQSLKSSLKHKLSTSTAIGIILATTIVAGTFAFFGNKWKNSPIPSPENTQARKKTSLVFGSSEKPLHQDYPEDMEMMGQSGPSMMSSSLHTTSSRGRRRVMKATEEDPSSFERNQRRESVTSSVSYGSFTTYERLPIKKGLRDEGEVTPVRRSSRIRQLTSP